MSFFHSEAVVLVGSRARIYAMRLSEHGAEVRQWANIERVVRAAEMRHTLNKATVKIAKLRAPRKNSFEIPSIHSCRMWNAYMPDNRQTYH